MTGCCAEVTDDSFHRPDRTIYCYLKEDYGEFFSDEQIQSFEQLGETVKKNGGTWLANLEEITEFLNSSKQKALTEETYYDGFMSFSRQESYGFAHAITNRLNESGFNIFVDLNDIPLIIYNEEYIYSNILKSDNFIYVISSNAIRSEYCKKELDFVIKNNKRIIPVRHGELSKNNADLDSIFAKKKIIEPKKNEDPVTSVFESIKEKFEIDRDYVRKHTLYLIDAKNWRYNGESQSDLLFGTSRKNAIEWLKASSSEQVPFKDQIDFVEASKKLSLLMLPLLWLNKKTKKMTSHRWFDKITLVVSLGNPVAMADQLRVLIFSDNPARYEGVSIPMWVIFIVLQFSFMFVGIKTKNLGVFVSMILSMIICAIPN